MTKEQIDAILDRVREWPDDYQEDAARVLLAMDPDKTAIYELSEGGGARYRRCPRGGRAGRGSLR